MSIDLSRDITEEDTKTLSTHMRGCSISHIIRELHIEAIMR
jgi:hypothetical protein